MPTTLTVDVHLAPDDRQASMARDARAGLAGRPKTLPPVWFYDERGSLLFDQITRLPEYYLTRAERTILAAHATEIVAGSDTLVELGSGTSDKTHALLGAMASTGALRRFVPFDVSEEVLRSAASEINQTYDIDVWAVVGDFHHHLDQIPTDGRRLVAFLGSTIGNLTPAERHRFLAELAATMGPGDTLLLGSDLVKDVDRLRRAYDDEAGVTAAFNRNVLRVLNAELGADFDPDAFDHVAHWNRDERWIEMRLRARRQLTVAVRDLDLDVHFEEGEDLRTEISAKFTPDQVAGELAASGFTVQERWTDPDGDFLLTRARPTGPSGPPA